jgi:chemotaxis regulatin CheY-phosphate phosphatase CheZ
MPERAPRGAQSLQQNTELPKQGLAEDYAALEATLRNSPLGRWFLAEYARRNRTPETQLLLDAIARLEAAVLKPHRQTGFAGILAELVDISEAIVRTRREIAQLRPPHAFDKHISNATEELDLIVGATETATSDILSAAEEVQEVAWMLREQGIAPDLCDKLDQRAIDIYTACSFQDITGQRTAKVVRMLRQAEERINAMISAWSVQGATGTVEAPAPSRLAEDDSSLLNGPSEDGEGLKQHDVDEMLRRTDAVSPLPAVDQWPEGERFERPEPLTLDKLHAVKRAALFG